MENCDCGDYIESQSEARHIKNCGPAYSTMRFSGGPLHGQHKRMDVYTAVIVLEWNTNGVPKVYYQNVNAQNVDRKTQTNRAFTHYVFFVDGHRLANVDKNGNYVA
jgi:hypothetical protein